MKIYTPILTSLIIYCLFINANAQPTKGNTPQNTPVNIYLGEFTEVVQKLNNIIIQQKEIIEKQNKFIEKIDKDTPTPNKEKSFVSKLRIGISLSAYRTPKTIQYRLLGNSNPLPDTIKAKMGLGINAVLLWDFNQKLSAVISIPIVQSLLAFNAQSVGAKQVPFGVGLAWSVKNGSEREIFRVAALLNFAQFIEIPESGLDCKCFPISSYGNLRVGERIPEDIISKRFEDVRIRFSPSINIVLPIKDF